jgi:hypothetical protein
MEASSCIGLTCLALDPQDSCPEAEDSAIVHSEIYCEGSVAMLRRVSNQAKKVRKYLRI